MLALILFWSTFPAISMAYFITPGKPIDGGAPITPGQPITGGQFIIPGKVFPPGQSITGGKSYSAGSILQGGGAAPISGQPIIPNYQSGKGQFIIPNIAGSLPINQNWLVTGTAINGGDYNGQNVTDATAIEGGQGSSGGKAQIGGDSASNGEILSGGKAPDDVKGSSEGEASIGGNGASNGAELPGGKLTESRDGTKDTTSDGENGFLGNAGSKGATSGNNELTGGTSSGEQQDAPSILNFLVNSTKNENGLFGIISQGLKDAKTFGTSFIKPVLEGSTAVYAGFKFEKLKSGNYKVHGKSSINNRFFNHFYDNFKKYKINGKERYMPASKSNQRSFKVSSFFDSKKLALTKKDALSTLWKNTKSSLNDGYNVFSKKFWVKSNFAKLNGPLSITATLFGNVDKHGSNAFKSSKFYADMTVDLAIGAGTTAVSSVLSSAVTGAMAGSVVPGIGTIVGAGIGLGVGFLSAWFINGTSKGRRAKEWVSNKISEGYSWAADKVRKGASWVADKAQGLFDGAKKLFGFG